MQSMTGFAKVQGFVGKAELCWELRTVNHRYLDVSFRLPEAWRFLEMDLRSALRTYVTRGKLECQLKWLESPGEVSLTLNHDLLSALLDLGKDTAKTFDVKNDLSLSSLLSWPQMLTIKQANLELYKEEVLSLFHQAILTLQAVRKKEGEALKQQVNQRLQALYGEIKHAELILAGMPTSLRDKLMARLQALPLETDAARFEQELVILLTKMDASEELDRLRMHADEVAHNLSLKTANGRRLDFLMQELNREANTLSSKSDNIVLTQHAVEMKVLIEQMREQIQNIE